jgi:hypothetical protein
MFNISRAKSGKLKSQKAPSLLGKQRQSGNIRFTVYYKKNWDKLCQIFFWGGGEVAEINLFHKQFFRDWSGTIQKSRGKFLSAPLIFSFPYAHEVASIITADLANRYCLT